MVLCLLGNKLLGGLSGLCVFSLGFEMRDNFYYRLKSSRALIYLLCTYTCALVFLNKIPQMPWRAAFEVSTIYLSEGAGFSVLDVSVRTLNACLSCLYSRMSSSVSWIKEFKISYRRSPPLTHITSLPTHTKNLRPIDAHEIFEARCASRILELVEVAVLNWLQCLAF